MPLHKSKSKKQLATTDSVPELTHQSSSESVSSPITPSNNDTINPIDKELRVTTDVKGPIITIDSPQTPASAPATTTSFSKETNTLPSKDLSFLSTDPYADDDIIPFDKNKPIIPSRKGSVRSIMSTSSMQSLKRGLGSIKRSISRRRSQRKLRVPKPVPQPEPMLDEDGNPIPGMFRSQTYMMGPSFSGPQRVDTYQVSAMAF